MKEMLSMAKAIMVQGTSSHVGKSILCTALCRIFFQDGFSTAPFKAQNMALNSTVTPDGGEIGRAQGVQAEAARVQPTVYMNPILLKPKQDMEAQVIVLGKSIGDMSARDYRNDYLPQAEVLVLDCINRLKSEFEVLVIEGAGSPAEINLKDRDIVNMKTAELADAPVLLVADIDRGGVFASIIGTLDLLETHERDRVKALIINKFRGDIALLKSGLDFLEERTGLPVLGVIPYIHDHGIDEEDSVCLAETKDSGKQEAPIKIAVIELPRISNFTDINPFMSLPDTQVHFVKKGEKIGDVDLVIIPGTKNSMLDLSYLQEEGLAEEILVLAGRGKYVVGICGGYQMLGQQLLDPEGTEAGIGSLQGLGLLPGVTTFGAQKSTHQVTATILARAGFWRELYGHTVSGYEIHTGQTRVEEGDHYLLEIKLRSGQAMQEGDGLINATGKIFGTHIHGLFDNHKVLISLINAIRREKGLDLLVGADLGIFHKDKNYDRLADVVRGALDMRRLYKIMDLKESRPWK
jgi:adenosylcobyric acid synthase